MKMVFVVRMLFEKLWNYTRPLSTLRMHTSCSFIVGCSSKIGVFQWAQTKSKLENFMPMKRLRPLFTINVRIKKVRKLCAHDEVG
jgi:hypothetical protein